MRRFYLLRENDPSGISGTGRVADGVEFESGWCAIQFHPGIIGVTTIYPYHDIADMMLVHGHRGKTHIVWID